MERPDAAFVGPLLPSSASRLVYGPPGHLQEPSLLAILRLRVCDCNHGHLFPYRSVAGR